MEGQSSNRSYCTLHELNSLIKSAIGDAFPAPLWVTAEIAELKCNQRGHCYMELVERDDEKTVAQVKATVWAYEYRNLSLRFQREAGEPLRPGMKILLLAAVTFHEVYGMSLNVKDIDPTYSLGEMAKKKKEVIERLKKAGVFELNKAVPLPVVPQRIAVISSPNAAGYGDFFNQLDGNSFGYRFIHELFPALMQGPEAEGSIISSLEEILKKKDIFDVVVIIRGGGSAVDLSCFDGYPLADRVARSPVPVITGIGHEKDDSVVDMVAHTKMKTPTAVAEFLISGLRGFEEKILGIGERIISGCEGLMKDENYRLHSVIQKLALMPVRITASHENRLTLLQKDLNNGSGRLLSGEDKKLGIMEKAVGHLDPASVLRRGYSITRHKGKVIRDPAFLKKWAVIETRLDKGTLTSIVQDKREGRKSGQGKADDLLPGFD